VPQHRDDGLQQREAVQLDARTTTERTDPRARTPSKAANARSRGAPSARHRSPEIVRNTRKPEPTARPAPSVSLRASAMTYSLSKARRLPSATERAHTPLVRAWIELLQTQGTNHRVATSSPIHKCRFDRYLRFRRRLRVWRRLLRKRDATGPRWDSGWHTFELRLLGALRAGD
jgi:hypothetical protein